MIVGKESNDPINVSDDLANASNDPTNVSDGLANVNNDPVNNIDVKVLLLEIINAEEGK